MVWRIEVSRTAEKAIAKLSQQDAKRIIAFLKDRIATLDDPRALGRRLTGDRLGDYWRYRVGDMRIICSLIDGTLTVLVVDVGHRRDIYR